MIRNVTYAHRDARPPRKKQAAPLTGPAIVTTANCKRRIGDGPPLPMELPRFRKPVEREGDDYKRMKAAMTRQLRGRTN